MNEKEIAMNIIFRKKTNAQQFNINLKRRCVRMAVACFISRCICSVSYVHYVTSITSVALRELRWI